MTADDTAATFPEVTITSGGLVLRPLSQAGTDDVVEACQDPETLRWLPLPRPYMHANAEWFIGTFGPSMREAGTGIVFAIESAGRLAGVIDLKHVDWASKAAEVGYWVAPWARGRGTASQATRALAEWAIRDRGFERVAIFAATENLASQQVARKAGFVQEGVARNAGYVHHGRVDMVLFSLIPDDLLGSR